MRNILFDLDDTILDFRRAERVALADMLKLLGVPPAEAILRRYREINATQWKLLEEKKISRREVDVGRFQMLFDEFDIHLSAKYAASCYDGLLGIGHYFVDGAEALLRTLRPDYRLYIITNGSTYVQERRIKSARLPDYVDDIFISEEIGADKPDPAFFSHCFAQIPGFSKQETLIVGDSLTSDILGGRQVGIKTVWFNPNHMQNGTAILPDYEIETLSSLPPLLETI